MVGARISTHAALASIIVACGSVALAGPLDRSIVDPNAVWLVHLDVDAAKGSPVGQHMVTHMQNERHGPLARMECELGISPSKNLKAVTVFALPTMVSEGIVIFTTDDAADHLGERLSAANSKSYRTEKTPQGVPVHVWRTRRGEMRAAVYPGRRSGERFLVLADSASELEAGVASLTSRAAAAESAMPAAEPAPGSIVFFTSGDLNHLPGQEPPKAAILQASRSLVLDVGETPAAPNSAARMYGNVVINTDDAAAATKVKQMSQGILALLTSPGDQPAAERELMNQIIENVKIATDDHRCMITSDHDAEIFAKAMDALMEKNAAAMKARHEARDRSKQDDAPVSSQAKEARK